MIRRYAFVAAFVVTAGTAMAQQRCEGTLCDLYYGGAAPEQPAVKAAPTPLTVPNMPSVSGAGSYLSNMFSRSDAPGATQATAPGQPAPQGAAPQRDGFFHIGGGGVAGQKSAGECGGTICDLLHGHSAEDEGGAGTSQSVNGVPQSRYGNETASAERAAEPAPAVAAAAPTAAQPPAGRRVAVRSEPKPPPACALKSGDPWACYRR